MPDKISLNPPEPPVVHSRSEMKRLALSDPFKAEQGWWAERQRAEKANDALRLAGIEIVRLGMYRQQLLRLPEVVKALSGEKWAKNRDVAFAELAAILDVTIEELESLKIPSSE
jgi:hypothetical protein